MVSLHESKSLQGSKVKRSGGLESKPMSVVKTPSKGEEDKYIYISAIDVRFVIFLQSIKD